MAVDSRAKGSRAELGVRDSLRTLTGLQWERVPASGGLSAVHGLKGDLYVPNEKNLYCVEVKHYAEDHLTSELITSKSPKIHDWWEQTIRESGEVSKEPVLIFKYDRSKLFVGFREDSSVMNLVQNRFIYLSSIEMYVMRLEEWIEELDPIFIK